MSDDETATVLVVDDERDLADDYAHWLSAEYETRTAYSGEEALEEVDASVDVVLLDRSMPGLSGSEVLEAIRDRGFDCKVAMVTAVEPDFDIVEMAFDDYVVKPLLGDDLLDVVDTMLTRRAYDEGLQEYFSLVSKAALLESRKTEDELEDSEEYAALKAEAEALRNELDQTVAQFGETDFDAVFHELSSEP